MAHHHLADVQQGTECYISLVKVHNSFNAQLPQRGLAAALCRHQCQCARYLEAGVQLLVVAVRDVLPLGAGDRVVVLHHRHRLG